MASDIERAIVDSNEQCQGADSRGQRCLLKVIEGQRYCKRHIGFACFQKLQNLAAARNYAINNVQLRKQVEGFRNNSAIFSLRDEIALLRTLIDTRLNRVNSPDDLIVEEGPLTDLMHRVGVTVAQCAKAEKDMGELMDKTTLAAIAGELITVVIDNVTDSDALARINDRFELIINRIFPDRQPSTPLLSTPQVHDVTPEKPVYTYPNP